MNRRTFLSASAALLVPGVRAEAAPACGGTVEFGGRVLLIAADAVRVTRAVETSVAGGVPLYRYGNAATLAAGEVVGPADAFDLFFRLHGTPAAAALAGPVVVTTPAGRRFTVRNAVLSGLGRATSAGGEVAYAGFSLSGVVDELPDGVTSRTPPAVVRA